MVVERAEVSARVRVKPLVHELGHDIALDFERARRDVHQLVKTGIELRLVRGKVREPRHIERYDADRARALAASEEAARLLAKLAESRRRRQHILRTSDGSMSELM